MPPLRRNSRSWAPSPPSTNRLLKHASKARRVRPDAPSTPCTLYYSYHDCIKTIKSLDSAAWTQRTLTTRTITYSSFTHVYSLLRTRRLFFPHLFSQHCPRTIFLSPAIHLSSSHPRYHPTRTATLRPGSRGRLAAALRGGVVTLTTLRRTADEPALDHGAHGWTRSGRLDATRHKTAAVLETTPLVAYVSPTARAFLFPYTHTVFVAAPPSMLAHPSPAGRTLWLMVTTT